MYIPSRKISYLKQRTMMELHSTGTKLTVCNGWVFILEEGGGKVELNAFSM